MGHLALITFVYGSMFLVPSSINYNRRKKGLKPYWMLLLAALGLELALLFAFFFVISGGKTSTDFSGTFGVWLIYIPPVVAAAGAGFFYALTAKLLDARNE